MYIYIYIYIKVYTNISTNFLFQVYNSGLITNCVLYLLYTFLHVIYLSYIYYNVFFSTNIVCVHVCVFLECVVLHDYSAP